MLEAAGRLNWGRNLVVLTERIRRLTSAAQGRGKPRCKKEGRNGVDRRLAENPQDSLASTAPVASKPFVPLGVGTIGRRYQQECDEVEGTNQGAPNLFRKLLDWGPGRLTKVVSCVPKGGSR